MVGPFVSVKRLIHNASTFVQQDFTVNSSLRWWPLKLDRVSCSDPGKGFSAASLGLNMAYDRLLVTKGIEMKFKTLL